jgi:drug/metabolite transporter (DMT)-like permease
MFPLSRLAIALGWSPLAFAFWPALGSGLILALAGVRDARPAGWKRPFFFYSVIAGVFSVAIPNSLTYFVMTDLGTSLTALMFTLPPLFTYAFASIMGMEPFRPLRLIGILVGLAGAALLVLSRYTVSAGSIGWLLLAICVPVSLAIGNVYRKLHMPHGMNSSLLAGGMLLGGALVMFPVLMANGSLQIPAHPHWHLLLMQGLFTCLGYVVYFRFQKVADPVYFSQLGYVMSAMGVVSGLLFFNELLTPMIVAAILVIVAGIAMVNRRAA